MTTVFGKEREMLGDLTDRDRYTSKILAKMHILCGNSRDAQFTMMIDQVGIVEVNAEEQKLLQYVTHSCKLMAQGMHIELAVREEMRRREELTNRFRGLLRKLRGTESVNDEEVEQACVCHDEVERHTQTSQGRHVPPRTSVRIEQARAAH
jgi:hypothetical protein